MMQIVCPYCRTRLSLNEGGASCPDHGRFRCVDGILSVACDHVENFENHWRNSVPQELSAAKLEVGRAFLRPLSDEQGFQQVLDVGCGDGVHLSLLGDAFPDVDLYGVDISLHALKAARGHSRNWKPIQADAEHLPFADNSFDVSFSYGVLAYLEDPWRGLSEMVRVTRPDGLMGVWFYPKRQGVFGRIFSIVRSVVTRLPQFAQHRVADLIVPVLRFLPTSSGLHLGVADWRSCREVVLVNIAPRNLIFPSEGDIVSQFRRLDCEVVYTDPETQHAIWAPQA